LCHFTLRDMERDTFEKIISLLDKDGNGDVDEVRLCPTPSCMCTRF
jgi:hypothetical protein